MDTITFLLASYTHKKTYRSKHFLMVEMMGLEPIRPFRQRILSPLRLPIPPHLRGGSCRSRTGARRVAVCCLTTWLRNQSSVKLQRFIIILKAFIECNRSISLFISSLQIFFSFFIARKSLLYFDFIPKIRELCF